MTKTFTAIVSDFCKMNTSPVIMQIDNSMGRPFFWDFEFGLLGFV